MRETAALRATYRLQLHGGLPFSAVSALVPYLDRLGISHAYSAPLLKARTGSLHGYDVTDPTTLNPEIGSLRAFRGLARTLQRHGMGLVLDIVPNHVAASHENPAWSDVLAHGRYSRCASWFDIDWDGTATSGEGRLILPVLGGSLSDAIGRRHIRLVYRDGVFQLCYFEHRFPVDPATLLQVLLEKRRGSRYARRGHRDRESLERVLGPLRLLAPATSTSPSAVARQRRAKVSAAALRRLHGLYLRSPAVRAWIDRCVAEHNGARGGRRLRALLTAQPYRLVPWWRAGEDINYRRFFNVHGLVGVRVEDPAVFAATHARVVEWATGGLVQGLRIDHIDGLLDPLDYLRRLRTALHPRSRSRRASAGSFPIYVEKILCDDEVVRSEWPVQGTTGYEFIASVEPLFVEASGFAAIDIWYRRRVAPRHGNAGFAAVALRGKRRMLAREFAADVKRLTRLLSCSASPGRQPAPRVLDALASAIVEVLAFLPVYRTYVSRRTRVVAAADRDVIRAALAAARRGGRAMPGALALLEDALLLRLARRDHQGNLAFVQRFQQTSGAVMAKGVEDTALYVSVPLVSLNEVGCTPSELPDDPVAAFHRANETRATHWPRSMLCSTTHDTKRSADVRARLDVLSEMPETWIQHVTRWCRMNHRHRERVRGRLAPDDNTAYLFYQTLVGIWPLRQRAQRTTALPPSDVLATVRDRVATYMLKAVREAGLRTRWGDPDAAFESVLEQFIHASFEESRPEFLADLARFVGRVARPGLWNAISRTLIHLTAPGLPDMYQGDELWNFTLVDPDNRQPVDFQLRRALLADLEVRAARMGLAVLSRQLADWPEDGRIKLHVVRTALGLRREDPTLFCEGRYEPLRVEGQRARHVVAFMRRRGRHTVLTVAPRLTFSLLGGRQEPPRGNHVWSDTRICLPADARGCQFTNVLTGQLVESISGGGPSSLRAAEIFDILPAALLVSG